MKIIFKNCISGRAASPFFTKDFFGLGTLFDVKRKRKEPKNKISNENYPTDPLDFSTELNPVTPIRKTMRSKGEELRKSGVDPKFFREEILLDTIADHNKRGFRKERI